MTVKTYILYRTHTFNGRKVLTPCTFSESMRSSFIRESSQSFTQTIPFDTSADTFCDKTLICTSAVVLPGTIFVGEAKTDNDNIMLKT